MKLELKNAESKKKVIAKEADLLQAKTTHDAWKFDAERKHLTMKQDHLEWQMRKERAILLGEEKIMKKRLAQYDVSDNDESSSNDE